MPKSPLSLKGLIPTLAGELDMTPAALYERQRALVRAGLIKSEGGKGPGSGVRATPHSVAMLLIAVLAADSLSEIEEGTKRIAWLKAESGICPVTNKKTFATALAAILASPSLARSAHRITVHRAGTLAPGAYIDFKMTDGAYIDFKMKDAEPSSYFVSAKHKRPGKLHTTASLMGFPLQILADLLAPWFAK